MQNLNIAMSYRFSCTIAHTQSHAIVSLIHAYDLLGKSDPLPQRRIFKTHFY